MAIAPIWRQILQKVYNSSVTALKVDVVQTVGGGGGSGGGPATKSGSDEYTGPADGTTLNTAGVAYKYFSLQVDETNGTVSAWEVLLEGSNNGTTWQTLVTHTKVDGGNGGLRFNQIPSSVLYFRTRCVSLSGSSTPTIVAIPVGVQ